jgi:hypothetical protein
MRGRIARLILSTGCSLALLACGEPTDQERLQEEVQTTSVQLYVALKVLAVEPERNDDVKSARKLLDTAVTAMTDDSKSDEALSIRPADALALGRALWALREIGAAEVKAGRDSTLAPVFTDLGKYAPGAKLDRASDHAVLLLALMLAKLHPKAPTPVPHPLLLYEAWMTGEEPLAFAPLEPLARSAQAYAYASAELCDLAAVHTQQLADQPIVLSDQERAELVSGLGGLGRFAAHASPDATLTLVFVATVPWWSRIVAHLTTARCLDGRERAVEATREWQRAVDVAAQVGFPAEDLALVRAYLAHRSEDDKAMREHLIAARSSHLLDEQAKRDLEKVIEHYDADNQDSVTRLFNPLFVTGLVLSMSYERMKQAGVFDALAAMPAFQQARGVIGTLESAVTPEGGVKSLLQRATAWLKAL